MASRLIIGYCGCNLYSANW